MSTAQAEPQISSGQQQITPDRIMQICWGFAPPLIIESAIHHHVFDVVDAAPKSLEEICKETKTDVRATRSVADALVGLNLLSKDKDGRYSTTPESSAFLISSKPSFMGGLFRHVSNQLVPPFLNLTEIMRVGSPADTVNKEVLGTEFFKDFVEDLFPMMYAGAMTLAHHIVSIKSEDRISVLDLAAGSGVWSVALAQISPKVKVTAVDWAGIIPVTKRVVERCGVADQYSYSAGDLLEADFGEKHSLAILGNIIHSEGEPRSHTLLEKTFHALADGGTIAIAEFLVNEERTEPLMGLIFAVNMVVHTQDGYTYSFEEIRSWLEGVGFENVRLLPIPGPSPLILADKPKSK